MHPQDYYQLKLPRLHWPIILLATQHAKSAPPNSFFQIFEATFKGAPPVVWKQQMEKTYIERYNKIHLFKRGTCIHQNTTEQSISTSFRSLPEIADYEPRFVDAQYERDPYWDDELPDQEKLEFVHNDKRMAGYLRRILHPLIFVKRFLKGGKCFSSKEQFFSILISIFPNVQSFLCFFAEKTSKYGRKSFFLETIPFETHSTAALPPLAILKKNRVSSGEVIYFFKRTQILTVLRSLTISVSAISATLPISALSVISKKKWQSRQSQHSSHSLQSLHFLHFLHCLTSLHSLHSLHSSHFSHSRQS